MTHEESVMQCHLTRREWFIRATQAGMPLLVARRLAADAPTAPVAVARCKTYDARELLPAMQ